MKDIKIDPNLITTSLVTYHSGKKDEKFLIKKEILRKSIEYLTKQNLIHPILLAWSVVIFVYEFLSINIIRLNNKQRLFKAGQDHLHHILLEEMCR